MLLLDTGLPDISHLDTTWAPTRVIMVEEVLFEWACDRLSTAECKKQCLAMGYQIDFRAQRDSGPIEADDLVTGQYVELEV